MRAAFFWLMLCGCSTSTPPADAATDGAIDSGPDLCDLDRFFDGGGNGNACPFTSARRCFHANADCPTTGCKCLATPMGPQWKCTTDLTCKDSGADDSSID